MRFVKQLMVGLVAVMALVGGTGIVTASADSQGTQPDPSWVVAANAASGAGGPITRATVIRRAQDWVNERVPYSQTSYHHDRNGTYRQDCSGYISEAWDLRTSMVTWTLPQVSTPLHSLDDLRQGDMIDRTGGGIPTSTQHVVLFDRWADSHHQSAWIYEEAHTGTVARHVTYGRSYLVANSYHPYRYKNIR
jgi:hypothetical protein